jgi:hypothetical protein
MSKRENRAAAAEFRELAGVDFDEFTRRAPIKLLLAIGRYAAPTDIAVLQFADETHPLFQQQRARLERTVRHAWQIGEAEYRRQIAEVVRRLPGLSAYMLSRSPKVRGAQDGEN